MKRLSQVNGIGYHRKMSIFETWNTYQSNDTMRFPQS